MKHLYIVNFLTDEQEAAGYRLEELPSGFWKLTRRGREVAYAVPTLDPELTRAKVEGLLIKDKARKPHEGRRLLAAGGKP